MSANHNKVGTFLKKEQTMKNRYLIILFIVLSVISLSLGVINIFNLKEGFDYVHLILITSRIPRLVSLILAAIGLSISGVIFQQISRNKFVSPDTAATLEGAQLGLVLAMVIFKTESLIGRTILSFVCSLLVSALFMRIISKFKTKKTVYVPLIGIMLGAFINSFTIFIAYKFDVIQVISSWFYGDFSKIIEGQYELLYLSIPLIIVTFLYVNKFTIVALGKDFSTNLGVDYHKFVNLGLIIISMISAVVMIIVGNIPFIGLVIPNIISLKYGDNLKKNIWKILLLGPIFLMFCDIISRIVIYPYEVPIGVTAGVFGALLFLVIINRRAK